MNKSCLKIQIVILCVVSIFTNNVISRDGHLSKVLYTPALRLECEKFFDNVLRQIPTSKLIDIVDEIESDRGILPDDDLYQELSDRVSNLKSWQYVVKKIKALKRQKKILSEQAQELLGDNLSFDGCVEIGTPATYLHSMKGFLKSTGKKYVVSYGEQLSDYVQSRSLNPVNGFKGYDEFVNLNDYEPIAKAVIPDSSVDLVVCFIGFHHIPEAKMDGFLSSIKRILRPGGVLLLRDHDACTDDVESVVHVAHTTFNIISAGESLDDENSEYRNFQPLDYWIKLLDQHGFDVADTKLLQDGDPTLNTMMKFTRRSLSDDDKILSLSIYGEKNVDGYEKDIVETYLTAPEWANVDAAQEYGDFINHTPFYEFPYWKTIASYWAVFRGSFKAASKRKGFFSTLFAMDTAMNLFIGVTMTVEYAIKSAISAPLRLMFAGSENETIGLVVHDPKNELLNLDDRIEVVKEDGDFKLVNFPRYKEFLSIINKLKDTDVIIQNIAGQEEIQFKVCCLKDKKNLLDNMNIEYEWEYPTKPDYVYLGISVAAQDIVSSIKYLHENGIDLLYVHDF